ncbi:MULTISPECIES: hypothetical protein [Streptomyces]|uniref:hypothetical protein n=1 Tax=Streptomyces TaxID=1883 RepID=UPI00287FD418|nr:hypothetical protein [Streptomyces sp. CGMCC 4.1456]WNF67247.1 hypothetical protein RJD14_33870 [Streptomyces sp. CGMCC 4.1456]
MSTSVWIGAVAGIVGTATGGALSIWSARWTHRAQERTARTGQQRARAAAAAEAAMTELLEIHRDFRKAKSPDEDEWQQRLHLLHDRIAKVQVLLHSIPDAKLRTRVREDTFYMPLSPPDDRRTGSERRVAIIDLCADAVACLGAFLRDEEMPARSAGVENTRNLWPEWKHKDDSYFYMWESDDGDSFN